MSGECDQSMGVPGTDSRLPKALLWRLAVFLGIFAALQGIYGAAKGGWFEHLVIDRLTVQSAALVIDYASPELGVEPSGSRLKAPGGGINVLNGCEGMDVVFLITAAMLVAPISWRARLLGILCGTLVVLVLNQARVIALFYAFRRARSVQPSDEL